ncbi:MAG: hypothetical protein ACLQU3_04405 [Limisphaerales bacterium]
MGEWTREVVFLLSSLTLEQLQVRGMLELKRRYWVIESRLHHCLDITMHLNWVRTPNSALMLGMLRRVVLSLSNAAVDKARKHKTSGSASSRRGMAASASTRWFLRKTLPSWT